MRTGVYRPHLTSSGSRSAICGKIITRITVMPIQAMNGSTHVSIPETLLPEGNKSRVAGDGVESNHPATNFPGFSVGSNRVDRVVEETGLARRLESLIKQD